MESDSVTQPNSLKAEQIIVTVQTALRTCCAERENVLRLEYRICPFAEGNWNGKSSCCEHRKV